MGYASSLEDILERLDDELLRPAEEMLLHGKPIKRQHPNGKKLPAKEALLEFCKTCRSIKDELKKSIQVIGPKNIDAYFANEHIEQLKNKNEQLSNELIKTKQLLDELKRRESEIKRAERLRKHGMAHVNRKKPGLRGGI